MQQDERDRQVAEGRRRARAEAAPVPPAGTVQVLPGPGHAITQVVASVCGAVVHQPLVIRERWNPPAGRLVLELDPHRDDVARLLGKEGEVLYAIRRVAYFMSRRERVSVSVRLLGTRGEAEARARGDCGEEDGV